MMEAGENTLPNTVSEIELVVRNADGLHMRPAMQFVDVANQFSSDVKVTNGATEVDGKSIMQMSMLAATCGTRLTVRAQGDDAQDVVSALKELVEERHFDEPLPD